MKLYGRNPLSGKDIELLPHDEVFFTPAGGPRVRIGAIEYREDGLALVLDEHVAIDHPLVAA